MGTEKLFTVRELAEHLRVKPLTVYLLIKSGKLPALRLTGKGHAGRSIRIRAEDVEAYITLLKPVVAVRKEVQTDELNPCL